MSCAIHWLNRMTGSIGQAPSTDANLPSFNPSPLERMPTTGASERKRGVSTLNIIFISGVLAAGLEQLVRGRPANNEFWARFLRAYALDQQEPLTRHSACLARRSASTPSAHFQMTGFINTDLYDRSALVQMTGNYYGLDPAGR